jgi:ferredoxin
MVKVNIKTCIGCGLCASICPQAFEMKDGKAKIKEQKDIECVNQAISDCPVGAISK